MRGQQGDERAAQQEDKRVVQQEATKTTSWHKTTRELQSERSMRGWYSKRGQHNQPVRLDNKRVVQ